MTNRNRNAGCSGFTLMEAMIATLILAFALSSILAVLAQSGRYMTDIRRTARAQQVLQQEMEGLRLISDWSIITNLNNTAFRDPSVPVASNLYAGSISLSGYGPSVYGGSTNVVMVTLTVVWTNQVNRVITNTLMTYMSNGGLNKYIF